MTPQVESAAGSSHPDNGRVRRRRDKLSPDPAVRGSILAAAAEILRTEGVQGLSIAGVLHRCGLGTRAFYRHFASKDSCWRQFSWRSRALRLTACGAR